MNHARSSEVNHANVKESVIFVGKCTKKSIVVPNTVGDNGAVVGNKK